MGLYFNIALFLPLDEIENKKIYIKAIILEADYSNEYNNTYTARIKDIRNKSFQNFKVYIKTDKKINLKNGDIINATGLFSRGNDSRNYRGFSYKNYLLQKKIFGIIDIYETNKIGSTINIEVFFYKIKEKISISIEKIYSNIETKEFLKCILIGINLKDNEIKENFKNSNLSHVLAISGMHVSYIILAIDLIKIENKRGNLIIKFFILIIYLFVTGISVSCLRACMMYSLLIISKLVYRKNNIYITAFNTLIFSIVYNIYNIFNAGMWLSYAGMLGIVLFQKFIYKFFIYKLNIKGKIIKKIIEIACVSISAQIIIFPIMIYFFNTISLNFVISNLATYYIIGPIIIIGYSSIIFRLLKIDLLVNIIASIEEFLVKFLLKITEYISKYLNFNFYIITLNFITILMYFVFLILIIRKINLKKIKYIKLIYKFKLKDIEIYKNKKIVIIVILIILFNFIINTNLNFKNTLEISFIDVGQGDCTYIRTPKNKNILIDAGEGNSEKYDYGKNVVLPYLLDRKVNKLDYIFISHFDNDHVGGIFYILENMKVEKIFIGIQAEEYENYIKLKQIAKEKNIPIIILQQGNSINIEKEIYIKVLFPNEKYIIEENKINNNSLVFILYYNKFSAMFTGDIEEIAENEILKKYPKLNIVLLKVAHHGSKSSTTENFIENINPKLALIGVQKDNTYGHPNKVIINRLKNRNIKIFRTDLNGEIRIKVNKNGRCTVKTHI